MNTPNLHGDRPRYTARAANAARRAGNPLTAFVLSMLSVTAVGCQGDRVQSALHPASPAAAVIAQLWWVLLAILGLYTVAVFVLTALAIFRPASAHPPRYEGRAFILTGGVILPALILVPLLIYSMTTSAALRMPETGLTVRVAGQRWWWKVEYPGQSILTANEIYIPAGEPVRLELTSDDVIHSFWAPQLHGKMDMLPGATTTFWIQADRPGTYRGQCAEFCGVQHARMAIVIEALPPEEFAAWVSAQQQAADVPTTPAADPPLTAPVADTIQQGKQAFFRQGCAACHAIRGTRAVGRAGPDLTYIASRTTLGAATVPNTVENLTQWIIDPQQIKPGVNMPATHAPQAEIDAIVSYLQTLRYQEVPRYEGESQ